MQITRRQFLGLVALTLAGCTSFPNYTEELLVKAHGDLLDFYKEKVGKPKFKKKEITKRDVDLDGYFCTVYEAPESRSFGSFYHNLGGNNSLYKGLAKILASYGYSSIHPDMPGHGKTKPAHPDFSIEECFRCVEKVSGWIQENYPKKRYWRAGTSIGADVAIYSSLEYQDVDTVIAHAPMINSVKPLNWQVGLARTPLGRLIIYSIKDNPLPLKEIFKIMGELIKIPGKAVQELLKIHDEEVNLPGFCEFLDYDPKRPYSELPPTLVIAGVGDRWIPERHEIEVVGKLREGKSLVELILVDNDKNPRNEGSHLLLAQFYDEFGYVMVEWLNRNLKK